MYRNAIRVRLPLCRRELATFVDSFGAKDPARRSINNEDVQERNKLVGFTKIVGDPKKGLADDTRQSIVHALTVGINLSRFNPNNLCLWWEYDFTGGRILNNGQNALLSNQAKSKLYSMHRSSPDEWTVEKLAEAFRIRKQRVLAIIALKERAEKEMDVHDSQREIFKGVDPPEINIISQKSHSDGGKEDEAIQETEEKAETNQHRKQISNADWYKLCEWAERQVFNATAERGAGERHFVSVPTFPKFEEIPLEEADKYSNTEWEISRVNRMYTIKEDHKQTREFRERLFMNTGKIGTSLDFKTDRTQMHRSPPKHDCPIVVTSLDENGAHPYVAEADGTQRRLSTDEFLLWKRQNREAFTRLIRKLEKKREEERNENQDAADSS